MTRRSGRDVSQRATRTLAVLALAVAAAAGLLRWQAAGDTAGEDLVVICAGERLLDTTGNPYDHPVLTAAGVPPYLLLVFPPMLVQAWAPMCGVPPYWPASLAGLGLILLTWRGLKVPPLLASCAIVAGLGAFPWVALTGNFAMFEALAVGAATVALFSGAPMAFGVAIGAAAFIKSLTPMALALSAVRWPLATALRAIAIVLLTVAALQGLQWLIWPSATEAYWQAMLTQYPGHAADELAFATEHNPSPYAFMPIVSRFLGFGPALGTAAAGLISAAFLVAWLRAWRRVSVNPAAVVWAAMLLLAVIVVAHPRVKPYSLFALTPLLAFALSRMPETWRAPAIAMTCIAPHAAVLLLVVPPLPSYAVFVLQYSQWLMLAISVALALSPARMLAIAGPAPSEESR